MRMLMLLTIVSAIAATPAFADQQGATARFRLEASDLQTPAGAEAVYGRMMLRARRLCDPYDDFTKSARDACAKDLVGQWTAAIDDRRLADIHRRSG